jgi:hypothetical protein
MADTPVPEFTIRTRIQGSDDQEVTVRTEETTDGVPYYICSIDGQRVSELRRGSDGAWMQLWGELEGHDIKAVGKAIEDQTFDKD